MSINNKRRIIFIVTLFIFILIEGLTLNYAFGRFFPTYYAFELLAACIVFSPLLIFGKKVTYTLTIILTLITIVLGYINITLTYASNDVFSLYYLKLTNEATSVFNFSFIHWGYGFLYIGIFAAWVTGAWFILFKAPDKRAKVSYIDNILFMSMLILCVGLRVTTTNKIKKDNQNISVYTGKSGDEIIKFQSKHLKKTAMEDYGILSFSFAEFVVMNQKPNPQEEKEMLYTFVQGSNTIDSGKYFALNKKYNVLEIMIESGSQFVINETITPNLYKLQQESILFENNVVKNKTNFSECVGVCGSTPKEVMNAYKNPYSLARKLTDQGYITSYYHSNSSDFYNRRSVVKNFGFTKSTFLNDTTLPNWTWYDGKSYTKDIDFYDYIKEELIPEGDTPFYSFWTTLSTHGPYGYNYQNKFPEEYEALKSAEAAGLWTNICADDSSTVQKHVESYTVEMMSFDKTLGLAIERLKAIGKYDNTIIVLFGDHDVYYNTGLDGPLSSYIFNINPISDQTKTYKYEPILMISNPALNAKYKSVNGNLIYKDTVSNYIIVPTVLELLGIKYKENEYIGRSVFHTKTIYDNIFYSNEQQAIMTKNSYQQRVGDFEYEDNIVDKNLLIDKTWDLLDRKDKFDTMYESGYYGDK